MQQMTDGSVDLGTFPPTGTPGTPAPPAPAGPSAMGPRLIRPNTQLSRSQILDATEECLVVKGYDGTTIRRIAATLGCAVGSIYRYFSDKRELLDGVTQRRFRPVLEHVRGRQKVHRTALLYVQVATDQPELYRLMFWLAGVGKPDQAGAMPDIMQQIIDGWAQQLGGDEQAELFWSRLHGRLMLGGDPQSILDSVGDSHTTVSTANAHISATAPPPMPAAPQPTAAQEDVTLL